MEKQKQANDPLKIFIGVIMLALLTMAVVKALAIVLTVFFGMVTIWANGLAVILMIFAWIMSFFAWDNDQKTR